MECKNFLSLFKLLLQEWADKDKSLEMPLSAIPKSCCPPQEQETLVFDFDTVMKNFCSEIKVSRLSSVDGLYVDEQRNIIYLLEMKNVAEYIKYQQKSVLNSEDKFKFIVKFLFEGEDDLFEDENIQLNNAVGKKKSKKKATLADKAGDSYVSFFAMFGCRAGKSLNFLDDTPLIDCLLNKNQFKIKYFIVVDMGSEDYLKHRLAILNLLKQKITHGFLSSIELVSTNDIHEILENTFDETI